MNKAVSDYMRDMQRRSAESRWGGLTPEQRSAKMQALRAQAAKKKRPKTKAAGRRPRPLKTTETDPTASLPRMVRRRRCRECKRLKHQTGINDSGMCADCYDAPWPPSDAKPGDVWGAYRMEPDGWWRLNAPQPPNDQADR